MFLDLARIKKISVYVLSSLFALLSVGTVIYYIFGPSAAYFHSDCADTILWAQASVDGKTVFNPEFGYAALLPFGGTTVMIPLVAIFGVGLTAQHIGMTVFSLLFFASVFGLFKSLKLRTELSLFGVGVLALVLCSSEKTREIFYEHVIYYSIGVVIICVLLSLFIGITDKDADVSLKKKILLMSCLSVFAFLSAFDGTQVAACSIFPVLFAGGCEILFSKEKLFSKPNRSSWIALAVITVATVAGLGVVTVLGNGIGVGYASAYSNYSDMGEWTNNLFKLPQQWCELFGVDVYFGMNLFSVESIINIVRLGAAFLVALVPVAALIFIKKLDRPAALLVLTHIGVTGVVIFGYIFGILSLANWRLSPIICTGVLVCIVTAKQVRVSVPLKRVAALAGCMFVLFGAISVKEIAAMPRNGVEHNEYYRVAQYLESKGLNYGFATFWKSQTITVISDSRVKIANTDMNKDGITPCLFQSNINWFLEQEGVDRYFLLADKYEYFTVMDSVDSVYLIEEPVEIIDELDGYVILVYEDTDFLK